MAQPQGALPSLPALSRGCGATCCTAGRRYNQIVSATLLETIYKPIVQRAWVAAPRPPTDVAAGAAADAPAGPEKEQHGGSGSGRAGAGGGSDVAVRAGPAPRARPQSPQRRASLALALVALLASVGGAGGALLLAGGGGRPGCGNGLVWVAGARRSQRRRRPS